MLDLLTDKGLLQRIDVGAGTARFEPVHASGEHHHHLVCEDCGTVEAFADDELERALHKVEGRTGYSIVGPRRRAARRLPGLQREVTPIHRPVHSAVDSWTKFPLGAETSF